MGTIEESVSVLNYVSLESLVSVVGAIFGIWWKAKFTSGQCVFSKETAQDMFFGLVLAGLWSLDLPITSIGGVAIGWPPFRIPKEADLFQRFLIIAAFMYIFIAHLKKLVLQFAPSYFARWTGTTPNVNIDKTSDAKP